ncbi:MAG: hypothetical protein WCQ21_03860 [Verrucomicrobiota bacterium]
MKVSSHRLFLTWALAGATVASAGTTSSDSFRLPAEFPPEVACWFWGEADFKPGGYKEKIDLLADFLLMRVGEQGREVERQLAINYLLELVRQQNASVEGAFYSLVKKWLGPAALVGTHPTWISDPDNQGGVPAPRLGLVGGQTGPGADRRGDSLLRGNGAEQEME